ncbi:hypothetical protein MMC17_009730 [Xylographa soralifera]|nr:hypothetical protein [Xylographa soralifera]
MATFYQSTETADYSDKEHSDEVAVELKGDLSNGVTQETQTTKAKSPADAFVHEYGSTGKAIVVLVPVIFVYFLLMLDASVMATAIPSITSEFDSLLDIGWYGSAYQLASAALQPLSGKIYTYFSTKWSFLAFFFIFEVGSALCGAAQSSVMLIVGRAVAGLGASGLTNGALTIIAAILPPHRQPIIMGVTIGIGQLGVALGPLIGGALTEYATWRWCFYLNLPPGALVGIVLVLARIPESKYKPPPREVLGTAMKSLDLPGFALIAPAAIMFFLALEYGGNQFAWNSSVVIGLFVGAGLTLIVFLLWEWRQGEEAMVPFFMLRKRIIWSASSTMFFFFGCLFCAGYYLPIYFQSVNDDTALMSGVHTLPYVIAQVVFSILAGGMVETFGYYIPWVLGGTALTAIAYGLLSLLDLNTPVAKWVGYQILFGAGTGSAIVGSFTAVQNIVPAPQIPVAMAILIFCQYLGGATFLIVAETIFSNSLRTLITQNVPGINPDLLLGAGARSIRNLVSGTQLSAVLKAYSTSFDRIMYLGVGIAVASFAFAWGLGWKDIRVEKKKNADAADTLDVNEEKTLGDGEV